MTVCIGGICADLDGKASQAVIVASDRMVTWGPTEFEHEVPKATDICDRIVVLAAGDALRGSRIVRSVMDSIKASGQNPSVAAVAQEIATSYATHRRNQISNDVFGSRGFSIDEFYGGQQKDLVDQLAVGLDNVAATYNYNLEMLIGGVDDTGGHLFFVGHPGGTFNDFFPIGFAAVGSGQLHALQSMIGTRHTGARGLRETLFNVYASKRRAEVAPGVGADTDITIIRAEGISHVDEATLKQLATLYDEYEERIREELKSKVAKLKIFSPADAK